MIIALTLILAYLIGSIPSGLLLAKLAGLGDIRTIGSGNIGATNVLRTGNKKIAALTLLCDGLKGFIVITMVHFTQDNFNFLCSLLLPFVAGMVAILAHIFPVWLRFKGGKGVATAIGVLLALSPVLGGSIIGLWLVTFGLSRISSLSALIAFSLTAIVTEVFVYVSLLNYMLLDIMDLPDYGWDTEFFQVKLHMIAYYLAVITVIIFFTHIANIKRLFRGTEPRWGKKA